MRKEILSYKTKEKKIEISGNKIVSIKNKNITKTGARVFKDNKIYSASVVGNADGKKLLDQALSNELGSVPYDYDLPNPQELNKKIKFKTDEFESVYSKTSDALQFLKKKFPKFIFSGGVTTVSVECTSNIDGTVMGNSYDLGQPELVYKHESSTGIMDSYFMGSQVGRLDFNEIMNEYIPYLEAYEKVVNIKDGKLPVVFTGSNMIISKAISGNKADLYHKGVGLFKGRLGEQVLSKDLSIYDVSYNPEVNALRAFDGEGFVRSNPSLSLIENGVFKSLICDSRNGKLFDMKSTGNGLRSYNSATQLGFNKLSVGPGAQTISDILKGLPECLVIELAAGGDFTDDGSFSTPVQFGFLMKNGDVAGRLPQLTLTAKVQDYLGDDLIAIASDSIRKAEPDCSIVTQMNIKVN